MYESKLNSIGDVSVIAGCGGADCTGICMSSCDANSGPTVCTTCDVGCAVSCSYYDGWM